MNKPNLVFIGGGNMATCLIGGILKQGYPATQITACDPIEECRVRLEKDFQISTYSDNSKAAAAEVVILAVKPQIMKLVAAQLVDLVAHKPLIISIVAGIPVAALQLWLGASIPIVRCMPNTPALLQQGASGLFATPEVNVTQRALTEDIISAAGSLQWFDSESDIDAVTALSGSGPGYFFLVMEAMEDAGVKLGLDRSSARQLTIQTALGAASMAMQGESDPAELRRRVTSPGGTTERAINELISGGLVDLFDQAIKAAHQRSIEIAEQAFE